MTFLILHAELDERFGILGIFGPCPLEGWKSLYIIENAENPGLEFLRRRSVARYPVNLFPIRSQKKKEWSAPDVESLEKFLTEDIALFGPEKDKIFV
jgi:hypothetical protein